MLYIKLNQINLERSIPQDSSVALLEQSPVELSPSPNNKDVSDRFHHL